LLFSLFFIRKPNPPASMSGLIRFCIYLAAG
jgi:hypothetical protein